MYNSCMSKCLSDVGFLTFQRALRIALTMPHYMYSTMWNILYCTCIKYYFREYLCELFTYVSTISSKGQWCKMFLYSLDPFYVEDLRFKIFWFYYKIHRNFMSLGVFGEYDKILLALFPYGLNTFRVFSE
jgi:hypothetical protein